ncbi:MAG: SafA/ExsA family spore coat assembly protein [Myxococcota bacterium]|nr:SafA/ExsA family spore coat assembly protein [Myxococcota bacterium]
MTFNATSGQSFARIGTNNNRVQTRAPATSSASQAPRLSTQTSPYQSGPSSFELTQPGIGREQLLGQVPSGACPIGGQHTVASGDTLSAIARQNGVSLNELIQANPQIANPDLIYPGDKINIPGRGGSSESTIPSFSSQPGTLLTSYQPINYGSLNSMSSSPNGQAIANTAKNIAASRNTTGRCYAGVADALDQHGVNLHGRSAYMAANQLAQHPAYREINATGNQLRNLPAGAVVVWGQTGASPHGHISIADGRGNEMSDHIARQKTQLRGDRNARVFLPA